MIQELQDLLNVCDAMGKEKAKKILLGVAAFPEHKQKEALTLVKVLINPEDAGDILDKYSEDAKSVSEENDG